MKIQAKNVLNERRVAIMWVILGVLGRVIPHVPNVTPMDALSLFAGSKLSRRSAYLTLFITLLLSDIGLAYLFGYPIFSAWTLFTYTGFAAIIGVGCKLQSSLSWRSLPLYIISTTAAFWLWTNFGVWLTSGLYSKTGLGLISCYTAALPFLRNALFGDLLWGAVIFGSFAYVKRQIAVAVK